MGNSRFKFRIWDKFCETWLTDFAINQDGEINRFFNSEEALKRRFVLMQSTGLHDKNGKLIYEGDIVKFVSPNRARDFNAEIKYLDNVHLIESDWLATGYFCVEPNSNLSKCEILTSETALDYKVIGNIYENKKLLEEYKDE